MSLAKYLSLTFSHRTALLAATAMITPVAAFAQNAVTGNVVDENGAPLPGAQVNIAETGQRVITDNQGRFFIPSLPEGTVTLNILYRGLGTATETVTVTAGSTNNVTITLASAQEIVVLGGITDPTARALNRQKNADGTTNVISSDAIGRLPDPNIAEALQRVPGFGVERDQGEGNFVSIRGAPSEFTAVTVDGVALRSTSPDTRAIDLGTFNSELVSSIEVSKTLLPSQDADSIAGAINLTTRSAFDKPRLVASMNGGVSYNQLGGTNDYRVGGNVSDVFGPVGITLSGTLAQTDRRVDNFENIYDFVNLPGGGRDLRVIEQEFKDYDTRRQRITLAGAIELRPDNVSSFFLRGNFNRREDDEFRNLLLIIYNDGTLQPGSTPQNATWRNTRLEKEFRHRVVVDQSLVLSAGGKHDWTGASLDYSVAYTESEQTFPIRAQLLFRSNLRPTIDQDFTNPRNPEFSLFRTGEHLRLENYAFRQNTFREQDTLQSEWALQANLKVPTQLFGAPSTLQFGAKARLADVTSDNEQWRDRTAAGAPRLPLVQLVNQTPSVNFDYNLGRKIDPDLALPYFAGIRQVSQTAGTRRVAESITADYEAQEDIYAAYAMARMEFTRTNVILGLRLEHTNFSGSAPVFDADTGAFSIARVERSYTDFFPNLTVRHEFSPDFIGRFAASRATARPSLRNAVPRVVVADDQAGNILNVDRGNPDLRQTISNNLDAGIEYYFKPLGLIGFNVFYKDLRNYEFTLLNLSTFNGQPALITQRQNANGRILGAELNVQGQFTFLPGFWSGFGFFGNVAYADAYLDLPASLSDRPTRAPLPNQSDWTYNASLFYEKGPFNTRIAYTNRSDYVDEFAGVAALDTIWEGRGQVDVTASYDITKQINVFVEAKNITNTAGVRYVGSPDRVIEFEKFGAFYFVGARVNF
jgi:TonB-dependent receptor